MSEELLIRNCSPTLAGIKTGSIYNCDYETKEELCLFLNRFNKKFSHKGLKALPLKIKKSRVMIYVYRPNFLTRDLSNELAIKLLAEKNYNTSTLSKCICGLIKRLKLSDEFPHEIGLFLGYPPKDVKGFIDNKAANSKCLGMWKVYDNVEQAKVLFKKYKKCTEIFCTRYEKNRSIEQLIVVDNIEKIVERK